MTTPPHEALNLPQTFDDGLVLRCATPDDVEALAAFNVRIHEDARLAPWTRDMMGGNRPGMCAADFLLVEDPAADGKIVSTTCLIPQTWCYEGIPFAVGQPELVGTDEAYRRRGLTRRVMAAIHDLSAAYGQPVQAIAGIPWFYRQFGYEFALVLGGGRNLPLDKVPRAEDGVPDHYRVRPASVEDIPAIIALNESFDARMGYAVTSLLDAELWRAILTQISAGSIVENRVDMIEDDSGAVVGFYRIYFERGPSMDRLVLAAGHPYPDVLPVVLRALKAHVETLPQDDPVERIRFYLGAAHPVYDVLNHLLVNPPRPYAWYIRVPDLAAFIRHIAPALEKRLAASFLSGWSGDLRLNFYRDGLRLAFDGGKLTEAENLSAREAEERDAAFPPLTFLQLLFGHRSLGELDDFFPDCGANAKARPLLEALFPKKLSRALDMG